MFFVIFNILNEKKIEKKSKMLSLSQEKKMLPNYDHANDRNRKLCLFCNLHKVELKLLALKPKKLHTFIRK